MRLCCRDSRLPPSKDRRFYYFAFIFVCVRAHVHVYMWMQVCVLATAPVWCQSLLPSCFQGRVSCFCCTEYSRLAGQWSPSCLCLPHSSRNAVFTDACYRIPPFYVGTENPNICRFADMGGLCGKGFHLLSHHLGPGLHNLGDVFFLPKLEKSFSLHVLDYFPHLGECWIPFPEKLLLKAIHLANSHLLYLCQIKELDSTVEFQIGVLSYNFNKCLKMDHWGEGRRFKVHQIIYSIPSVFYIKWDRFS